MRPGRVGLNGVRVPDEPPKPDHQDDTERNGAANSAKQRHGET